MTVKEFYSFCAKAGMENANIELSWGDRFETDCTRTLVSDFIYYQNNKVYIDSEYNCIEKIEKKYNIILK